MSNLISRRIAVVARHNFLRHSSIQTRSSLLIRPFSDAPQTTPTEESASATANTSSSDVVVREDYTHLLDAFRDPLQRDKRMEEPVGRRWSAKELRRKSFDDLHRLWLVLYKERNMLLTEQHLSRQAQLKFPQKDRLWKVQKSMGAIRYVYNIEFNFLGVC